MRIDEKILGGAERGRVRPRGFIEWHPQQKTLVLLEQVNAVLAEYRDHLPLTLRQVFYRLVGAYGFDKTERAYKSLGETLNLARRARMIDMDAIRDDGLTKLEPFAYLDPVHFKTMVLRGAERYLRDRTEGQERKLVLWCEAKGMVPQIERVAEPWGVSVLSSGGFDSTTIKHDFARECANADRPVTVLHIGDHDPSGVHIALNMAEDVEAFAEAYEADVEFHRLAVTPEQVRRLRLPTAPPKEHDTRAFTGETTQAEAIAPDELARIVEAGICEQTDMEVFEAVKQEEARERRELVKWSKR